jgi:DNA polymerase III subunit gamma/tau
VALALYRKYRPATFAEVVGQEHVTEPLQQALRNDRVHHAYLFSGPRGCGKTTSARILARSLNCVKGPTPDPCGVCDSCISLAPNGPGSLDVIEIDAASHNGVDDARDLRERAFYAPVSSRFKIYIIDEAHMVTAAAFNALLKLVEEPPEFVKFVFATTEPDKVIGTIRSRTHHYPFRLIPPGVLRDHLARLCQQEQVTVEPGVLPLVVRAGAGSARDAMSVLDQLFAGADAGGVTYAMATALLGYTDATLLDDVIDAFAASDAATVFTVVDRIIEGGHDPRRFVADLLERLRDLIILAAVPDAASKGLVDCPEDQLERMSAQAGRLGSAELTRAADIVNAGLTEMRGATSPRLQLELICARVLLPGAEDTDRGVHARLDRLERRLAMATVPSGPAGEQPVAPDAPRAHPPAPAEPSQPAPAEAKHAAPAEPKQAAPKQATPEPVSPAATSPAAEQPASGIATSPPGMDLPGIRRMWPEILDEVKRHRRYSWMILLDNAQIAALDGRTLTVAFSSEGAKRAFTQSGSPDILQLALIEKLGVDWQVETILDPGRRTGAASVSARAGSETDGGQQPPATVSDEEVSADDELVADGESGAELVQRMLGARKIGEFDAS